MTTQDFRTVLFKVFMAIFVATASITLLGVAGVIPIKEGYLNTLFTALVVELIGAVERSDQDAVAGIFGHYGLARCGGVGHGITQVTAGDGPLARTALRLVTGTKPPRKLEPVSGGLLQRGLGRGVGEHHRLVVHRTELQRHEVAGVVLVQLPRGL